MLGAAHAWLAAPPDCWAKSGAFSSRSTGLARWPPRLRPPGRGKEVTAFRHEPAPVNHWGKNRPGGGSFSPALPPRAGVAAFGPGEFLSLTVPLGPGLRGRILGRPRCRRSGRLRRPAEAALRRVRRAGTFLRREGQAG